MVTSETVIIKSINGVDEQIAATDLISDDLTTGVMILCEEPDGCALSVTVQFDSPQALKTLVLLAYGYP